MDVYPIHNDALAPHHVNALDAWARHEAKSATVEADLRRRYAHRATRRFPLPAVLFDGVSLYECFRLND